MNFIQVTMQNRIIVFDLNIPQEKKISNKAKCFSRKNRHIVNQVDSDSDSEEKDSDIAAVKDFPAMEHYMDVETYVEQELRMCYATREEFHSSKFATSM